MNVYTRLHDAVDLLQQAYDPCDRLVIYLLFIRLYDLSDLSCHFQWFKLLRMLWWMYVVFLFGGFILPIARFRAINLELASAIQNSGIGIFTPIRMREIKLDRLMRSMGGAILDLEVYPAAAVAEILLAEQYDRVIPPQMHMA